MTRFATCFIASFCFVNLSAQHLDFSAAAAGMGQIITTEQGSWSLFGNMAGIGEAKSWSVLSAYRHPFGLRELQSIAIGIVIPVVPTFGLSFTQFGRNPYQDQQISINAIKTLGQIDFGLRLRYWHRTISGIDQFSSLSASLGLQLKLSNQLLAGVLVSNLSQSHFTQDEPLPSSVFIGVSYSPHTNVQLAMEISQQLGYRLEGKLGLQYRIFEKISASTGISTLNGRTHAGVGFNALAFSIDYALSFHRSLGITHQAGLNYSW